MRILKEDGERIKGFTVYLSGNQIAWIKSNKQFNVNYFLRKMLNKYIEEVDSIKLELNREDILNVN